MNADKYRDAYFLFGSACRLFSGKMPIKEWQHTLDAIWSWSKTQIELLHTDVPDFTPPSMSQVVTQPINGAPVKAEEPPVEHINDIQLGKFKERCRRYGYTSDTLKQFLASQGIEDVAKIPLSRFKEIWDLAVKLETLAQYR